MRGPGLQGDPGRDTDELGGAFEKALAIMAEFRVPVVVEVILEKVTNIALGSELNTTEFEELSDHEVV